MVRETLAPGVEDLVTLCHAQRGVVALAGAGGKKTAMIALASRHAGRVGLATTVHMPSPGNPAWRLLAGDEDFLLDRLPGLPPGPPLTLSRLYKPGVLGGLDPQRIPELMRAGGFDVLLIKADGARHRFIKAPAEREPVLPPTVDTLVYVVSAHAFGMPFGPEVAHRPERLSAVTGLEPGETITPAAVARLLASPAGARHHLGSARLVVILNRVDTAERERLARETARLALERTPAISRILLACMGEADPVVDVLEGTGER